MKTTYLIIGGGPSGIASAEAIRKLDSTGSVLIVDKEGERLYSKIIFHLFLSGKTKRENLFLRSEEFYKKNKIDLIKATAVSGDLKNKTVKLDSLETVEFDKLIIASGGKPRRLEIKGEAGVDVLTFYSLEDVVSLESRIAGVDRVLVIGGGFLTLDLLDALLALKKKVTLVMRDQWVLQNRIGEEGSKILEKGLLSGGIEVMRSCEVSEFARESSGSLAILKNGEKVRFDLAVMAVGLELDLAFAHSLGLKTDQGIIVDRQMRTSHQDVYACGDICQHRDLLSGDYTLSGNWLFAQESGKIAGGNVAGGCASSDAKVVVSKRIFRAHLFFCGTSNKRYQMHEKVMGDKYLAYFTKEEKIVGISALNLADKSKYLLNQLGQKLFEQNEITELMS